jgi:hypothetical protein
MGAPSHARASESLAVVPRAAESGIVAIAPSHDARDAATLAHFRAVVMKLIDDALGALHVEVDSARAYRDAPAALRALASEAEESLSVEELSALLDRALETISDPNE